MNFGEKVRHFRKQMNLSQAALARAIGVSARSVAAYEAGASYPRYRETYEALARALGVSVNDLRTEDEAPARQEKSAQEERFLLEVGQEFGAGGQRQARAILDEARQLFAGGQLSDEDQLAFLTEMQQLFLDSRRRAAGAAGGDGLRE